MQICSFFCYYFLRKAQKKVEATFPNYASTCSTKNMLIIRYKSNFFNILNQKTFDLHNKMQDITALRCHSCPNHDSCPSPRCVFNGHYPHRILLCDGSVRVIWIQRILGIGCRRTASLVPSFHIPFHPFLFQDAHLIILCHLNHSYDSSFFDFDSPIFISAISRLISSFDSFSSNSFIALEPIYNLLSIFNTAPHSPFT